MVSSRRVSDSDGDRTWVLGSSSSHSAKENGWSFGRLVQYMVDIWLVASEGRSGWPVKGYQSYRRRDKTHGKSNRREISPHHGTCFILDLAATSRCKDWKEGRRE